MHNLIKLLSVNDNNSNNNDGGINITKINVYLLNISDIIYPKILKLFSTIISKHFMKPW